MNHRSGLPILIVTLASLTARPLVADDQSTGDDEAQTSTADQSSAESDAADEGAPDTKAGVQFEATFSPAGGATLTTTNGGNEQREGTLLGMYAAYASVPEGQPRPLKLRVTEDETVKGPDDQPGVLRLQYVEVPIESNHSGFLMYGDEEDGRMQLPGWTPGEVTMNDLRRTFIEFKFRADNPDDPDRFGTLMQFRLEPAPQSYPNRADFGVLIATGRWRTFRRPIGSAGNLEKFLEAVNGSDTEHFKLVWSQNGSVQNYAPGDSLLIDDIRIVIE